MIPLLQPGHHNPRPDKPREFRCDECGKRCTVGRDGTEYGHERGAGTNNDRSRCPRRPDDVDPSARGPAPDDGGGE